MIAPLLGEIGCSAYAETGGIDVGLYCGWAESTLACAGCGWNQIPLVLSISGIGFALFFYCQVPLVLSVSWSRFCLYSVLAGVDSASDSVSFISNTVNAKSIYRSRYRRVSFGSTGEKEFKHP